ncbi:hypothetical protein F3J02_11115 [Acinetobacter sp. Tr-809]|uniref:hypothetical protein n=1 Tax=Acinetobacter sp. Tr-809 TaxID=2608324 RepID=UPI0014229336|nr:hypothetical protein [Acinetobacter sp. Tr-809]NIE97018.1 hypothetical protein [Acinetobacter sp. Tr-809]
MEYQTKAGRIKRNTKSGYRLLVDYKNFLQEMGRQNDYNSRLIFITNYLEAINFELYGVEGKEQLIVELEKYYTEDKVNL